MARLFKAAELPHLHSTRDTRDRLDLITDSVPVDAKRIRADRIVYHPGDTAAKHYHTDCHHLFYVLEGRGTLHVDDSSLPLAAGDIASVGPSEVHSFENDSSANFAFVEFWSPPPTETIWTQPGDI
jgi:mannose-6-phosphate isomerase-like protein (cupin superfamily)